MLTINILLLDNLLAIRKHLQDGCPHSGQRRENNGKFAEGKCAGSIRDIATEYADKKINAFQLHKKYHDKKVVEDDVIRLKKENVDKSNKKEDRAKQRQGTRTDIVENLPQSDKGKSRDKVAKQFSLKDNLKGEELNYGGGNFSSFLPLLDWGNITPIFLLICLSKNKAFSLKDNLKE